MSSYRDSVGGALEALTILSPTSYSWFGSGVRGLSPEIEAAMDAKTARSYLLHQLQAQLYDDFYCRGEARPSMPDPWPAPRGGPSPLVQALSKTNAGSGSLEGGWRVVEVDRDEVVVERDGLRVWASPHEILVSDGVPLTPGAVARVLMPKELLRLSPGYYMALGDVEFPAPGTDPLVRFYWNLRSGGAVRLVGLLTRALNEAWLAFRLKVVSASDAFVRCDAGVLYTPASQYDQTARVVAEAHAQVVHELKASTPAFTKPLAPGLGLSEDPAGGLDSFGMTRCGLLADAALRAAELGAVTIPERLDVVAARFAEDGIDLDAPYLNSGSTDRYVFP